MRKGRPSGAPFFCSQSNGGVRERSCSMARSFFGHPKRGILCINCSYQALPCFSWRLPHWRKWQHRIQMLRAARRPISSIATLLLQRTNAPGAAIRLSRIGVFQAPAGRRVQHRARARHRAHRQAPRYPAITTLARRQASARHPAQPVTPPVDKRLPLNLGRPGSPGRPFH
jgi:hypothetical protein